MISVWKSIWDAMEMVKTRVLKSVSALLCLALLLPCAARSETLPTTDQGTLILDGWPVYPEESRRLGEQGTVLLKVAVSSRGKVLATTVGRSSGFPRLDQAAQEIVSTWAFSPARKNGLAVAGRVLLPIEFRMTN
jgi:TonB family protein